MDERETIADRAQVRDAYDSAALRRALRSLRESLDRGDHRGITPAAIFELCAMLDTAANDISSVPPHQRRDLLTMAAEIHPLRETEQTPTGQF